MAGGAQVRLRESAYPETFLNFRRGDPRGRPFRVGIGASGRPRPTGVTAHEGRAAQVVPPLRRTTDLSEERREGQLPIPAGPPGPSPLDKGSRPSPTVVNKLSRDWGGGGPWASRQGYAPEALAEETQAHDWNRSQRKFLQTQGPVARKKSQASHSDFARRKFCRTHQECVPRNAGSRGKATMSTKCSSGAVPGGVLPSFSPWKKKLAARRRRNPLRNFPRKQGGIP